MTKSFMEQNGMESIPYYPYSPDLALSDFFLFPPAKKRLDRFECEDPGHLFEAIAEILTTVQSDGLQRVFQREISRVPDRRSGDEGSISDQTIHSSMVVGSPCSMGLAQRLIPPLISQTI
jgi:hypothetical protein